MVRLCTKVEDRCGHYNNTNIVRQNKETITENLKKETVRLSSHLIIQINNNFKGSKGLLN